MMDELMGARTLILLLPYQEEPDIRVAMIQMSTIQAATFPADSQHAGDSFLKPLLERPGIYVLAGQMDGMPVARIGQSENVLKRLGEHRVKANKAARLEAEPDAEPDEDTSIYRHWETTFVFTSKDETLSTGHIRHIEHRLTVLAEQNVAFNLKKGQMPSEQAGALPLHEKVTAAKFISEVVLLAEVLGLDLFESSRISSSMPVRDEERNLPPTSPKVTMEVQGESARTITPSLFVYESHGIRAEMISDGVNLFRVRTGSQARVEAIPTLSGSARNAREKLVEEKVLRVDGNVYSFESDWEFKSLSLVTQVVSGTTEWGKQVWKTAGNKTLGQWLEEIETEPEDLALRGQQEKRASTVSSESPEPL